MSRKGIVISRKLLFFMGVFCFLSVFAGKVSANSNVAAHWEFEEGTGSTASDSSGNGNTGTLYNMDESDWVSGHEGGTALDFDGSNDYVRVLDSDSISVGNDDFTISAWIYPHTVSGGHTVIAKVNGTSEKEYSLMIDYGKILFEIERGANDGKAETAAVVTAGSWQHVMAAYEVSTTDVTIYYNGTPQTLTSETIGGPSNVQSDNLFIGMRGGSYNDHNFDGLIDDVKILNSLNPYTAHDPSPFDNQVDINSAQPLTLSWEAGTGAVSHDIYYGSDYFEVLDANHSSSVYRINQTETTYDPCSLEPNIVYYWRIDEVTDTNVWTGQIWSFRTLEVNRIRPLLGVIRWDMYSGYETTQAQELGYLTGAQGFLRPEKWNWRAPFFARYTMDVDWVSHPVDAGPVWFNYPYDRELARQATEQEILYAKEAEIDFWTFPAFPPWYGSNGWGLRENFECYLESDLKAEIDFCVMVEGTRFDLTDFEEKVEYWVELMQDTSYVKILGNRPLFFLWNPDQTSEALGDNPGSVLCPNFASAIQHFRDQATAAGLANPYIIPLSAGSIWTEKYIDNGGCDGLSAYLPAWGATPEGEKYNLLAMNIRNNYWDIYIGNPNRKMTAPIMCGADGRPRAHPTFYWEPIPGDIKDHLHTAYNYVLNHPTYCETNALLMYSWNEHSEGGTLCPLIGPRGDYIPNSWRVEEVAIANQTYTFDADLRLEWRFDEGKGTAADDFSGNSHQGTLYNGPQWVPGKLKAALRLDGNNDYVKCTGVGGSEDITVIFWIKADNQEIMEVVNKAQNDSSDEGFRISLRGSGGVIVWVGDTSDNEYAFYNETNTLYSAGQWVHMAFTFDGDGSGGVGKLYVNGAEATGGVTASSHGVNSGTGFRVGYSAKYPGSYYYDGLIDEVKLYSRVLEQSEIQQIYNSQVNQPGRVSNLSPSDEATGLSNNVTLNWTAGEGAESYDVYFAKKPPEPYEFKANQTATTYNTGPLDPDTTYYWRIDTVNSSGKVSSPVWRFTTTGVFCDGSVMDGDFNRDCRLDFEDLQIIASRWLDRTCVTFYWCDGIDVDNSGSVGWEDLKAMVDEWLADNEP